MTNVLDEVVALEHEATAFGLQWETTEQLMAQIQSECEEVAEHLQSISLHRSELQEEIGDLLHAVLSLCVFCRLDPEETLTKAVKKFERRLHAVKAIAKERKLHHLKGKSFDELMQIWKMAKDRVG